MRKRFIFLIIALVIVLGVGGYLLYIVNFKEYDVADEVVTKIVKEPYKVELPGGVTILMDEDGNVIEETKTETNKQGSDSSTGSNSDKTVTVGAAGRDDNSSVETESSVGGNTVSSTEPTETKPTETKPTETKPTVATIKEKYKPAMKGLEAQATAKVNAILTRGKDEYTEKKAKGESINYAYFYNKYTSAANDLEVTTDTIFSAVLKAVENDLVANGMDKSYAQSFKDEYEATKKARRDSLLSKAMENF